MRTEEEIVKQIKYFQDEYETYVKVLPDTDHRLMQLEAFQREIEALEWVIGYHVKWDKCVLYDE